MAISDAIVAGGPTVFMVEEERTSRWLDAARLLPAIFTGGSYVDCVICYVYWDIIILVWVNRVLIGKE